MKYGESLFGKRKMKRVEVKDLCGAWWAAEAPSVSWIKFPMNFNCDTPAEETWLADSRAVLGWCD